MSIRISWKLLSFDRQNVTWNSCQSNTFNKKKFDMSRMLINTSALYLFNEKLKKKILYQWFSFNLDVRNQQPDLTNKKLNRNYWVAMGDVDPETLLEWLSMGQGDERDMQLIALEQLCMLLLMSDNVDRCFER